jgi:hypothetical protein
MSITSSALSTEEVESAAETVDLAKWAQDAAGPSLDRTM